MSNIKIYFHNYKYGPQEHYQRIYDEIFSSLKDSGLLYEADLKIFSSEDCLGEDLTLIPLYEDAINTTEEYYILYLHNKGVTHLDNKCDDWRDEMLFFNVKQYKTAIKYLQQYEAVGIRKMISNPLHFSGNFWWSKASFIRKHKRPKKLTNTTQEERGFMEAWIGENTNTNKLFDLYGASY